ncbi:MAG: Crp/Fnr family transcriptional regulator [Arcobacter butzleri]|nr:Crp/Fnr family transcriptional regulator [Arcobacteraceae bacterium]MDY0365692.1 Crp/Fnr family transcriptional regulator [Arcobacteraceae bacterium]NLO18048.1 Crp/Fnr family transcriptional regulator [Aliarcobacter butzleri]
MFEQIKKIDFFANFSNEDFNKISNHIKIKEYKKDNIIFYESDMPKNFYILTEGEVTATKSNFKNNQVLISTFRPISFIAEMAIIEGIAYPATATCVSNSCKVIEIDANKLLELIKDDANIAFGIVKSLTKKIKTLEHTININILYDSTQKVINFLSDNPEILKTSKHSLLAQNLNITPETFSRTLKKLKDQEIIDEAYNVDLPKLKSLI